MVQNVVEPLSGIRQQNGGRQTEKLIWKAIQFELRANNANTDERSLTGYGNDDDWLHTLFASSGTTVLSALTPPTGAGSSSQ